MTESREPRNIVTLREHIECRLQAIDRRFEDFKISSREAVDIMTAEVSRRLDLLNNEAGRLLSAQAEMQMNYLRKEVFESELRTINEKLDSLQHTRSNYEGRSSVYAAMISLVISIIVTLVGVYARGL